MRLFLQFIIMTLLCSSQSINEQLKELEHAPPKQRVKLMNHIKEQLILMNQEQRTQTINKLRAKLQPQAQIETPQRVPIEMRNNIVNLPQINIEHQELQQHIIDIKNHHIKNNIPSYIEQPVVSQPTVQTTNTQQQPVVSQPTVQTTNTQQQPVVSQPTVQTTNTQQQPVVTQPNIQTTNTQQQPVVTQPTVQTTNTQQQPVVSQPNIQTTNTQQQPVVSQPTVQTTNTQQPVVTQPDTQLGRGR